MASSPEPHIDLGDSLALLARTPRVLDALLRDLPEPWLTTDEGPGTFSPRDVLGHLVHGERVDWMVRTRVILEHGPAQVFEPFDRLAHQRDFVGRSVTELLEEFTRLRGTNVRQLRELALTGDALALEGRHPELGRVTLGELVASWVVHDLDHLGQIARVMAKRYRGAVGPWRAYLPILER